MAATNISMQITKSYTHTQRHELHTLQERITAFKNVILIATNLFILLTASSELMMEQKAATGLKENTSIID